MKKYRVLKPIVLGFLTPRDQYDMLFSPEDNVTLESDGHTIWVVKNDLREESITVAITIKYLLDLGAIIETQQE